MVGWDKIGTWRVELIVDGIKSGIGVAEKLGALLGEEDDPRDGWRDVGFDIGAWG